MNEKTKSEKIKETLKLLNDKEKFRFKGPHIWASEAKPENGFIPKGIHVDFYGVRRKSNPFFGFYYPSGMEAMRNDELYALIREMPLPPNIIIEGGLIVAKRGRYGRRIFPGFVMRAYLDHAYGLPSIGFTDTINGVNISFPEGPIDRISEELRDNSSSNISLTTRIFLCPSMELTEDMAKFGRPSKGDSCLLKRLADDDAQKDGEISLRSLTHYLPTFIDDLKEHDPDGYRKLRKKDPGFLREVAERKKESRGGN